MDLRYDKYQAVRNKRRAAESAPIVSATSNNVTLLILPQPYNEYPRSHTTDSTAIVNEKSSRWCFSRPIHSLLEIPAPSLKNSFPFVDERDLPPQLGFRIPKAELVDLATHTKDAVVPTLQMQVTMNTWDDDDFPVLMFEKKMDYVETDVLKRKLAGGEGQEVEAGCLFSRLKPVGVIMKVAEYGALHKSKDEKTRRVRAPYKALLMAEKI